MKDKEKKCEDCDSPQVALGSAQPEHASVDTNTKDWNLSDKIIDNSVKVGYNTELKMEELVFITDVKEFIRKLKLDIEFTDGFDINTETELLKLVDKLAGEKLTTRFPNIIDTQIGHDLDKIDKCKDCDNPKKNCVHKHFKMMMDNDGEEDD